MRDQPLQHWALHPSISAASLDQSGDPLLMELKSA